MNAEKSVKPTTNLNSTLRVIFSLSHAVLLVFCTIFVFVSFGEMTSIWTLLMVIPSVSFALGFFFNALLQYMGCSSLNFSQIALNSLFSPAFASFFLVLCGFVPDVESPIRAVLPLTLTPVYQKAISQGFYVFWSGLYGQVLASGFVQVCS
jgi:hypothetical protein